MNNKGSKTEHYGITVLRIRIIWEYRLMKKVLFTIKSTSQSIAIHYIPMLVNRIFKIVSSNISKALDKSSKST